MPELLPRPDHKKTYRQPLEYFVDGSIVILVGDRKESSGYAGFGDRKLYENLRIFTALSNKKGTMEQQRVFEEKPILDHLWIPDKCSSLNDSLNIPRLFAVGKIEWYTRKDGRRDLGLTPVDQKTHLEVLFFGTVFIYGLHILDQIRKLLTERVLTESRKQWRSQLEWLKTIAKKFKQTIKEKSILLDNPKMLKYIDSFLIEIENRVKKSEIHIRKMSEKKGFGKRLAIYN